jgi:hypothetical protein
MQIQEPDAGISSGLGAAAQGGKELSWSTNDRTAGSIPVWSRKPEHDFAKVLAYQDGARLENMPTRDERPFGFGDVVDMVNPLQHIPLVNIAYREVTGDEIRPIGKIIGGALFGGPMGVTSGIVDVIVTEETGKDMAGNAIALVLPNEDKNDVASKSEDFSMALLEQEQLSLPALAKSNAARRAYERIQFADARTAGTTAYYA